MTHADHVKTYGICIFLKLYLSIYSILCFFLPKMIKRRIRFQLIMSSKNSMIRLLAHRPRRFRPIHIVACILEFLKILSGKNHRVEVCVEIGTPSNLVIAFIQFKMNFVFISYEIILI